MNSSTIITAPRAAEAPLQGENPRVSFFTRLQNITSLSKVLRIFGACAVLASMSLFLLEGWAQGSDVQRYLKLLAQTGLLTVGGVACSYVLKEYKSARVFFALGLISVVANFTILGALIYSMMQWDGALLDYPAALTWQTVNALTFWPTFAGASLLLAVISYFGYSIFARKFAAPLTFGFLGLNAVMLLPLRESLGIAVLLGVSIFGATKLVQWVRQQESFIATPEANFALLTLFLPALIILARAVSLYHVDQVLAITLSALAYYALRAWSLSDAVANAKQRSALQGLSDLKQLLLAGNIAAQTVALLAWNSDALSLALFSTIVLAFSAENLLSTRHSASRRLFFNLAASGLVVFNLAFAVFSDAVLVHVTSLLVAAALYGLTQVSDNLDLRYGRRLAILAMLISAFVLAANIISLLHLNNWILVGLSGGALIVGASLYERFGLRLAVSQ